MPLCHIWAYAVGTVLPSMVRSMTMRPPYPPENSATVTVPSAVARIGVPSGAAKSVPVCIFRSSVIGCTRIPNGEVSTQEPSGSGNTTRNDETAGPPMQRTGVLPPLVRAARMPSATGA